MNKKTLLLPLILISILSFSQTPILKQKGKQYFYVNNEGEKLFGEKYSYASKFINGLAYVSQDEGITYKLINTTGKVVYNTARGFIMYDRYGCIAIGGNWKYTFISYSKPEKLNDAYDYINEFRNGYASVIKQLNEKEYRYAVMDSLGQLVTEHWYDELSFDHDGCFLLTKEENTVKLCTNGSSPEFKAYQIDSVEIVAPVYPGGDAELMRFLAMNTRYPDFAKEEDIQGRVFALLLIDENGILIQNDIFRHAHPLLANEAYRVFNKLGKFKPATRNGVPVKYHLRLPINFKLF